MANNSAMVITIAEGIIMNKDTNLLACNGAKSLLTRMGFVKRKVCSKAKVNVSQFQKLKDEFLLEVSMDEIPADLVINFDQTALSYVPTSLWTMEQEGTKRV